MNVLSTPFVRYGILLCLAIAVALHFAALVYGLPLMLAGDEFVHVATAFLMAAERTLVAHMPLSYVPPLLAYLTLPGIAAVIGGGFVTGAFASLAAAQEFAILHSSYFIIIPRLISGLFFVAFLIVFFRYARLWFGQVAAYIALLLAAFDFQLLHEAQLGHFWLPEVFFIVAASYALARVWETGKSWWYVAAAIAIGLGYGMGYIAILLVPFAVLAYLVSPRRNAKAFVGAGIILAGIIGAFSVLGPVSFVRQFGRALETVANTLSIPFALDIPVESGIADVWSNLGLFAKVLAFDNPLVLVCAIAGMLLLAYQRQFFKLAFVAGFPMLYLLIGSYIWTDPDYRYVLPVLPFLMLAAAFALSRGWEHHRGAVRMATGVIAVLMLAYAIVGAVSYSVLLATEDTRISARIWMERKVEPGSSVLIDVPYLQVDQDRTALAFAKERGQARTRDALLATMPEGDIPRLRAYYASYFTKDEDPLSMLAPEWYLRTHAPGTPTGYEPFLTFTNGEAGCVDSADAFGNPLDPLIALRVNNLGPCIEVFRRTP